MYIYANMKSRYNEKKIMAASVTPDVNEDEKEYILGLFSKNSVDVVETYETSAQSQDSTVFNEFVVVTDNTNQTRLGWLLSDIDNLEDENDIGCWNEGNENGFYAKDYHFYHYAD